MLTWNVRSKKMNPFRLVTNFYLKLKSMWVVQFPSYHWMWICNSFRNVPGQNCCGWNMGPRATPTSPPSLQEDPRDKAPAPSAMSFAYPASTLSTSLGPGMPGNSRKQWCQGDSGCSGGSWWTMKGDDGWGMQPSSKSMQRFSFFFNHFCIMSLVCFPGNFTCFQACLPKVAGRAIYAACHLAVWYVIWLICGYLTLDYLEESKTMKSTLGSKVFTQTSQQLQAIPF